MRKERRIFAEKERSVRMSQKEDCSSSWMPATFSSFAFVQFMIAWMS